MNEVKVRLFCCMIIKKKEHNMVRPTSKTELISAANIKSLQHVDSNYQKKS